MEMIKINMEKNGRTDWRPLLDGEWHGLDFGGAGKSESKMLAAGQWARLNGFQLQRRTIGGIVRVRAVSERLSALEKGVESGAPSAARLLEEYMIKWNSFRRKTMVLSAPELMELAELLRELDESMCADCTSDEYWFAKDGIRARLERLLGMHPGSLDTSRK